MRHYVYALIDPRDATPFYVGKGVAARRFRHFKKAPLDERSNPDKVKRVRDIEESGLAPQAIVLSWHSTQAEAYAAEKKGIATIGIDKLTNKNEGGAGKLVAGTTSLADGENPQQLTPKQERFAILVAGGMGQSDAYREAYDTSNMKADSIHRKAKELMDNVKIAARIKQLKAPAIEAQQVTLDSLFDGLGRALALAEQTDQPSAMVAAMREMGKLADLYPAEKRENRNYDMTQLADRIQQGRDRLRVINGGQSDAG